MKITGFTIIKNAVKNDYPVVEAIRSILPVVDEMLVSIGDSSDDTEGLINSIGSPKIRIMHSVWDNHLHKGGEVLAIETNKAKAAIAPGSDWLFYIQGDEVIHEQYLDTIKQAALQYKDDPRVEGLLFHYLHFYGTYDYVGDSRQWYNREVRIIRNDPAILSYRDAQGFRKNGQKLKVKPVEAWVYHYGWVKSPQQMFEKQKNVSTLWHESEEAWRSIVQKDIFDFNEHFDSLAKFTGTHPAVMQERIARQHWKIELDTINKKFSA
ncbi:MAG: glycosyltransferase family 2 protein, partial [Bacteroidota bacterium]|nr:glycosyltransferase family 2 protein [Bacteroidota bacterium]